MSKARSLILWTTLVIPAPSLRVFSVRVLARLRDNMPARRSLLIARQMFWPREPEKQNV